MKKIPNICMRRLPWISQLELKELEMSKIRHHIWKQILYHHRNNFKNMDFFKVLLSRMKNHCHAKKKGRRSSLLFPPLPPGTIVTVITFQSPLKEYFFAGQKKVIKKCTDRIFTGNSCPRFGFCLLALHTKLTTMLWMHPPSACSPLQKSPGEESFLILSEPSCCARAPPCSKQNISCL